jgi:hypothetical protein
MLAGPGKGAAIGQRNDISSAFPCEKMHEAPMPESSLVMMVNSIGPVVLAVLLAVLDRVGCYPAHGDGLFQEVSRPGLQQP